MSHHRVRQHDVSVNRSGPSRDAPDRTTVEPTTHSAARTSASALGALGVVFGDIGTSPLYAFRESLSGHDGVGVTSDNVLGVLSLMLWSLIIVITVKYLLLVMRPTTTARAATWPSPRSSRAVADGGRRSCCSVCSALRCSTATG